MRGLSKGVAALAVVLLTAPALRAQGAEFAIGGGVSIPTGDFGDASDIGWQGTAAISFVPRSMPIGFQFDGTYSRFGVDGPLDINTQFIYGTGNVVYKFSSSEGTRFRPYLIGGLGLYNVKAVGDDALSDASETDFGINAGAGFDFKAGGAGLFIEGRFHNVFSEGPSDAQFIPITLGIRFGGN
jgi:hypothetical protein